MLVDEITGRIWVVAVWSHGNRGWHGSGKGLTPEESITVVRRVAQALAVAHASQVIHGSDHILGASLHPAKRRSNK